MVPPNPTNAAQRFEIRTILYPSRPYFTQNLFWVNGRTHDGSKEL